MKNFILLGLVAASLTNFSWAACDPMSSDVPSVSEKNYKTREFKKGHENGSEKRRHSGNKGVIDTEIQMEEHMPGDELRERTRTPNRRKHDYIRAE